MRVSESSLLSFCNDDPTSSESCASKSGSGRTGESGALGIGVANSSFPSGLVGRVDAVEENSDEPDSSVDEMKDPRDEGSEGAGVGITPL